MNHSTERALNIWKEANLEQNGEARMLGICDVLGHEAYNDDNSDDGFPHREMAIFARNKQIWQELNAR